jgi:hypothetical protein
MIVLFSDTSILIDLERGGLLEGAFSVGLSFVVPDLLYDRELKEDIGPHLRSLGLGVATLTAKEVAFAQEVSAARPGLSLPDCFALSCATRPDHVLVTGDGLMRKEAQVRLGAVYGLLWILDQMHASKKFESEFLVEGLTKIASHPRARLPADEVRKRLKTW